MGFRDLKMYQLAYQLTMEIFQESKSFPPKEKVFFERSDSTIIAQRSGQPR